MLINMDLRQIEVIVFAHLSKDKALQSLILQDKDIHKFIASNVYDKKEEDITKDERTNAKAATFGIIYGNGPTTLSQRTGQSFEWAKQFIEEFYELFPTTKKWHAEILERVEKTGQLKLFTGMILQFKKHPAKYQWQFDKGIKESYNPPDIKNYPVQHTAWVIMSMILGAFFRDKAIYKRDKYLLINTVHDSIMLDCKPEYVDECIKDIQEIVDNIPSRMLEYWNEKFELPIKIDITTGKAWSDL